MRTMGIGLAVMGAALALAGCKGGAGGDGNTASGEPSLGAPGKLTAGNYEVMRVDDGAAAQRFDVIMVSDSESDAAVGRYLDAIQSRLKPEWSGDTPPTCTLEKPTTNSSFIAEGHCTASDTGDTTDFKYDGKVLSEGFEVKVARTAHGKTDHILFYGHLVK